MSENINTQNANQEIIDTFSDLIETYRSTQQWNRKMIKRGKSAAKMYLITYVVVIAFIAAMIILSRILEDSSYSGLLIGLSLGIGYPVIFISLWIGHARLVRFWDLDYNNDRGWIFPVFFGMINTLFTLGIWGLVKSIKTLKECKGLNDNNVDMERQISNLQQKIEEIKTR